MEGGPHGNRRRRKRAYKGLETKAGVVSRDNIRQLQSEDEGARREGTEATWG